MLPQVQLEDPDYFLNCLRIFVCVVIRRNDDLRLSAFEMRAPIGHNPIATVWGIAPAAVSHDLVIRNARSRWNGVDRVYEPAGRCQSVDAGGHLPDMLVIRVFDNQRSDALTERVHVWRQMHK